MQELRLVGMSEDGTVVVLAGDDNTRFRLPIDEGLRAIVRRAGMPRLGTNASLGVPGSLRPRDIQARIRAGETAEEVARVSGLPVDKIRRYEGPVLAERGHVADQAQRGTVRRPGEAGPSARTLVLGDVVGARLQASGSDPTGAEWDAWRREDGRWTVRVRYLFAREEQQADFVFDVVSRISIAADNNGHWLLGEEPRQVEEARSFVPRLAAVGAEPELVEARSASASPAAGAPSAPRTAGPQEAEQPAEEAPPQRQVAAAGGRVGRRAAVPAWDDILLGVRRPH